MKPNKILGMNARNNLYIPENPDENVKFAYSKLRGKKILMEADIPHPEVMAVFGRPERIMNFPWEKLPGSFVLKPEGGNAGRGVLVVKKGAQYAGEWITIEGEKVTVRDLRLHALDILEGRFSTYQTKNRAFIEERIPVHPVFKNYTYKGTPDIRIIVFNWVPVMAMLRLPRKESGGRANLHQGAVGLGVDMATGITTYGYWNGERINKIPETNRKVNGLKIPRWKEMMEMAIKCQQATDLGFLGVDLVLHPEKGPIVLELNANPGLSIQIANMEGLRRRLERVSGLDVRNPKHGVKISQALFAAQFVDKVKAEKGLKIINFEPKIKIMDHKEVEVKSRVNTGWGRSAISRELAKNLELYEPEDILWQQKSSNGKVPVIEVKFELEGRSLKSGMKVLKSLDNKSYKVVLGRKDISGFVVSMDKE